MNRNSLPPRSLHNRAAFGLMMLAILLVGQAAPPERAEVVAIREALQPLQVVVGQWRGNTFRENIVHEANWAWDHRSKPAQPALVMNAPENPFFSQARLSYDPKTENYLLELKQEKSPTRKFEGDFTAPPETVVGDDGRSLQRTFTLQFDQTQPTGGEQWQVMLNQQENNRFLLELSKRRGRAALRRFDTVSNQRQGTSFAFSDEGYGEKTCIISGGLGTTPVAHNGKTYYVCCSGCQAAFEQDPEKWIAASMKKP